jgi:nucleoside phosphorylase
MQSTSSFNITIGIIGDDFSNVRWNNLRNSWVAEFGGGISDPTTKQGEASFLWVGMDREKLLKCAEEGRLDREVAAAGGTAILEILEDGECLYQYIPRADPVKRAPVADLGSAEMKAAAGNVDVLLLTVTDTEREAMLDSLRPYPGRSEVLEGAISETTYRFGQFGRYCAAHVECTMGGGGRQGATLTAHDAIVELKPKALLILGIAFGINRKKQRLGNVLIAESVYPYELQRVGTSDKIYRGTEILCGQLLSERFRMRRSGWRMLCGNKIVEVQQGQVLSGPMLIDNKEFRDDLVSKFSLAIGGEMEGAGAYAAAHKGHTEMILIKGICDWADGTKNNRAQAFAARAAVSLAEHVLSKPDVLHALGARDVGELPPGIATIQSTGLSPEDEPPPRIPNHHHPQIDLYLPRQVCRTEDVISYRHYFASEEVVHDLADVIAKYKRVALVCDAGTGKSTELDNLASLYSKDDSPFHVEFVHLNKYVDESIPNLLCTDWEQVSEDELLVILDGFDEIEAHNLGNAVRRILTFVDEHPRAHILISCRTNFYNTKTEQYSGTLSDFETYMLLDLPDAVVKQYAAAHLGTRTTAFLDIAQENNLHDLLRLPFYLIRLVGLFAANNELPRSRAEIFELLLQQRIDHEISRATSTSVNLREKRRLIIQMLERLALAIESLGRNYISDDEFQYIVSAEEDRSLVKQCTLFEKNMSKGLEWKFEHNMFQEFLAARALARRPLAVIKDFVSFKPNYEKVIPSWVNTVSFLISILEQGSQVLSEFMGWIEETDPELFVKFEPDKIEAGVRTGLVKRVFNLYKKRRIKIDPDKFDYGELARFGVADEIVDFLLNEAEESSDDATVINSIILLGYAHVPRNQKQRTIDILVRHATSGDGSEDKAYIQNRALQSLTRLKYTSGDIVARVVPPLRSSRNTWVRYALYDLLIQSNSIDEYIEVFLQGIGQAQGLGRLGDEHYWLGEGLKQATSARALKLILAHINDNSRMWERRAMEKTMSSVIANAVNAYETDKTLLQDALKLLVPLISGHNLEEAKEVVEFFDKTGTRLDAFRQVLAQPVSCWTHAELLAILADESCVRYFVEQSMESSFTQNVQEFQNALGWLGEAGVFALFNDLINEATGGQFVLPPPARNVRSERQQSRNQSFNLLFDKLGFINKIVEVFVIEDKDSFTVDELLQLRLSNYQDEMKYFGIILESLRGIAHEHDNLVTIETAVGRVFRNWESGSIGQIYEYLSPDTDGELLLTDEQRNHIESWCMRHLQDIEFKTALTTFPDDKYSVRPYARYLWFFRRKLGLQFPAPVLLDMLSLDGFMRWVLQTEDDIPLAEELNEEEATERILENLEQGITNDFILNDHLQYCQKHRVREVIPLAMRVLTSDNNFSSLDAALKTILAFPDAKSNLENALPNINNDFRWRIVDELVNLDSHFCVDYLRDILAHGEESEKLRASWYLVKLQVLDGLSYYAKEIIESKQYGSGFGDRSPLRAVETPEAIPTLLKLLEVSYHDNFVHEGFNGLQSDVLSALTNIAVKSPENYERVRTTIETFIEQNLATNERVRFLYFQLNTLERTYYTRKTESRSLAQVLSMLDQIDRTHVSRYTNE